MEKRSSSRWALTRTGMLTIAFTLSCVGEVSAVSLTRAEAGRIGRKVWQNECGGTVSGLTSWNSGEAFPSLGIGHFIWYPAGARGPFEESFPPFIAFARAHGAKLPPLLNGDPTSACPWNSRAEFLHALQSPVLAQLREFLAATVDLQADFLVQRLQEALPKMLAQAGADRTRVQERFDRVAAAPGGAYALVDYVNFKGEGILETERYGGEGWGLLQVLQGMNDSQSGQAAVADFAESAKKVLSRRVVHSPPGRNEARWLSGWHHRVNTYTQR